MRCPQLPQTREEALECLDRVVRIATAFLVGVWVVLALGGWWLLLHREG